MSLIMKYKHPGTPKMNKKLCAEGTAIMLGLKEPKKKRKPRKSGYKCLRLEDKIRTDIIKEFKKARYKRYIRIWRLEPSVRGRFGVTDTLIVNERRSKMTFMEVKIPTGRLSEDQMEFKRLCILCNIPHAVATSVEQAKEIIL